MLSQLEFEQHVESYHANDVLIADLATREVALEAQEPKLPHIVSDMTAVERFNLDHDAWLKAQRELVATKRELSQTNERIARSRAADLPMGHWFLCGHQAVRITRYYDDYLLVFAHPNDAESLLEDTHAE